MVTPDALLLKKIVRVILMLSMTWRLVDDSRQIIVYSKYEVWTTVDQST